MTQSPDFNKPGSGFTDSAVGLCQSCVTDGRKLFSMTPTHYWKARAHSHVLGASAGTACLCTGV